MLSIQRFPIIEKFLLYGNFGFNSDYSKWKPLPYFINKNKAESNLIFDNFKWLDTLHIDCQKSVKSIEVLTEIQELELKINTVILKWRTSEESNIFTNPDFFKNGVESIQYIFRNSHELSNEFLSNINTIKPKNLSFRFDYFIKGEHDFIRILKNVRNCSKLQFGYNSRALKLSFENVRILIKSDNYDPILIKWKRFAWMIDIMNMDNNFWISKESTTDISKDYLTYIHLIKLDSCEFEDHTLVEEQEVIELFQKGISMNLSENVNDSEFVIQVNWLSLVHINCSDTSYFINSKKVWKLINEIQDTWVFSWNLQFENFKKDTDQLISLHSKNL